MMANVSSLGMFRCTDLRKMFRVLVHCGNTATGCIIIQLCALYNVSITTSCTSRAMNKMLDAGAQTVLLIDEISPDARPSRR